MANKIKKHCTFDNTTYDFITGYAKSLGNTSFANANEILVKQGIANLEAQEIMNQRYMATIQSLENKLNYIEQRFKKFEDRTAALNVANIKIAGTNREFLTRILDKYNFTPSEIESLVNLGKKNAINELKPQKNPNNSEGNTYDY